MQHLTIYFEGFPVHLACHAVLQFVHILPHWGRDHPAVVGPSPLPLRCAQTAGRQERQPEAPLSPGRKNEKACTCKKKKKVFLKDICLLHNSRLRTSTRGFPGILNSRNTKHTVIIHRFDFNKLLFPLTHNLGDDRNAKVSKCFKLVGFNWNIYQEKYSDITRAVTNSPLVCNKIQIQYHRGYNHVITNSQYLIMRLRMSHSHTALLSFAPLRLFSDLLIQQ